MTNTQAQKVIDEAQGYAADEMRRLYGTPSERADKLTDTQEQNYWLRHFITGVKVQLIGMDNDNLK